MRVKGLGKQILRKLPYNFNNAITRIEIIESDYGSCFIRRAEKYAQGCVMEWTSVAAEMPYLEQVNQALSSTGDDHEIEESATGFKRYFSLSGPQSLPDRGRKIEIRPQVHCRIEILLTPAKSAMFTDAALCMVLGSLNSMPSMIPPRSSLRLALSQLFPNLTHNRLHILPLGPVFLPSEMQRPRNPTLHLRPESST